MSETTTQQRTGATETSVDQAPQRRLDQTPGVARVQAMIAAGQGSPAQVAEYLRGAPGEVNAVISFLHKTMGNAYVQSLLGVLHPATARAAGPAAAEVNGIPTGAVRRHDDDELQTTVTENKNKLSYADGNAHLKRTKTETSSEGENKQIDERSTDYAVGKSGVVIDKTRSREDAFGEDAVTKTSRTYGGGVGPKGVEAHAKLENEAKLGDVKSTKGLDASGSVSLKGEIEAEVARSLRTDTATGAHSEKMSAGINKEHQLELGKTVSDEQKSKNAAGADVKATHTSSAKVKGGLEGLGGEASSSHVNADGSKSSASAGISLGGEDGPTANAEYSQKSATGGTASAGASLDKNGISAHAGYSLTTAGGNKVATSVSRGTKVTASAPVAVGDHFEVTYVRTTTDGGAASAGTTMGGVGGSVGGDASSASFDSGVRTFESKKEAVEFQKEAASKIGPTSEYLRPGTLAGAMTMPIGETRGTGHATSLGANGSLLFEGASVGGGVHEKTGTELNIKRVSPVLFDVTNTASGEQGAELAISGGLTDTKSRLKSEYWSVTYRFDMSTDVGRAAYEKYTRDKLPPSAGGKLMGVERGNHADTRDHIKVAGLGDAGWKSATDQKHVTDAAGTHDEYKGSQSHDQDPSWLARHVTGDSAEHSKAELSARMENGKEAGYTATMKVSGGSGEYNREQLGKMSTAHTEEGPATASGDWTLSADIDKQTIHELEAAVHQFRGAKTQDQKMQILTELMSHSSAMMPGHGSLDVELKGDKNFPGRAGRERTEALLGELMKQIIESPASAVAVVHQAQTQLDALRARRHVVADTTKYTDLPSGIRAEQLQQIDKEIAGFHGVWHRALQESAKNTPGESIDAIRAREADPRAFANLGPEEKEIAHLRDQIADKDASVAKLYRENGEASLAIDHVFSRHAFKSARPGLEYQLALAASKHADDIDNEQAAGNAVLEATRVQFFTATGAARVGHGRTLVAMLAKKAQLAEGMYKSLVAAALHLSGIMTPAGTIGHEAFWSQFPLSGSG